MLDRIIRPSEFEILPKPQFRNAQFVAAVADERSAIMMMVMFPGQEYTSDRLKHELLEVQGDKIIWNPTEYELVKFLGNLCRARFAEKNDDTYIKNNEGRRATLLATALADLGHSYEIGLQQLFGSPYWSWTRRQEHPTTYARDSIMPRLLIFEALANNSLKEVSWEIFKNPREVDLHLQYLAEQGILTALENETEQYLITTGSREHITETITLVDRFQRLDPELIRRANQVIYSTTRTPDIVQKLLLRGIRDIHADHVQTAV